MQCGVKEIAVFASASEMFSKRNINCTIEESLERFSEVVSTALTNGIRVRGYISCVVGCPYEGAVPPHNVTRVRNSLSNVWVENRPVDSTGSVFITKCSDYSVTFQTNWTKSDNLCLLFIINHPDKSFSRNSSNFDKKLVMSQSLILMIH